MMNWTCPTIGLIAREGGMVQVHREPRNPFEGIRSNAQPNQTSVLGGFLPPLREYFAFSHVTNIKLQHIQ